MKKKLLTIIIAAAMLTSNIGVGTAKVKADTNTTNTAVGVSYVGHVQNIGWQKPVKDGEEAGTDGRGLRVEALKLNLTNAPVGAHIEYQAHVQNIGWQDWKKDGEEAGTDGKSLRVEAIRIILKNMPGYSVQYRAHVQNIGWQNWVEDGEEAGTDGQSLRVEALKIKIVKISDNSTVSVSYVGHVQNIGWQNPVENGQEAGTDGKALRVEALKLNLENAPAGAHIKYKAHVQNIGWQTPVEDGQEAGTDGKSLRVEAIKITLEGMPGYSVQYRAHVQNIGWQDWVKDGEEAGTDGKSLRVEAIEVRIIKTDSNTTGSNTGSNTGSGTGNNSGSTTDTTDYVVPLPSAKSDVFIPFSSMPSPLNPIDEIGKCIIKGNNNQYVSPDLVNEPAQLSARETAFPKVPGETAVYSALSDAVDVNMHGGYFVRDNVDDLFNYQSDYVRGVNTLDGVKLDILANDTDYRTGHNDSARYFHAVGVYAESTSLNSNDVTKLTKSAKTLHTQFMDKSQYDPSATYEHYCVTYNFANKINVITRFIVYFQSNPNNK